MTTAMTKRLARAVLIAGLALPVMTLLPANAPFAITKAHAAGPTTVAEFKSVLAAYGKWGTHDKYGDIWVPTVTPQGWHPYPPCQWVYTKNGWYFNDDTAWGSIVHHYGRWSHDEQIGWFWVPDQDWSPGWVVWRQSDQWVGWAPMPPQQDIQLVSTNEFNNDKLWIFMAADKFRNGGCGDTVQVAQAFDETQPVTWFGLYPGLMVDIDIDPHWTIKNIIKIIKVDIDIDVDIDINYCPPTPTPVPLKPVPLLVKPISPIHFPDPGPKDRKASNDPTPTPETPIRSIDPTIPVHLGDPGGKIGRVSNDPTPLKPVIELPLRPIGKVGRVDGDNGGKIGHGDISGKTGGSDRGTSFKGPHLSTLNSNLGHTVNPVSSPLRTPVATGPRLNAFGVPAKGSFNNIR